jgi:1,4-dihydroxy-6-naphthoate synthase
MKRTITLGHSPDADDAFMFYGLATGKVSTDGLRFRHILQGIQTLNERARRAELDVTALSVAAYPHVADRYAILNSGASIGDGYGPMIVARRKMTKASLSHALIAVPGELTSAFLTLKLYLGEFRYIVVPFDKIFAAVKKGQVDAGLIIHEGQLTYRQEGFTQVVELGRWWKRETSLPLPLGVNGIRKSLGAPLCRKISHILHASIAYGLKHRAEGIAHARQYGRGLDRHHADKFIGMYVNDFTLNLGASGRKGIRELLKRGRKADVFSSVPPIEFV